MARRGFFAELQHQAKVAAREREREAREATRAHKAMVREAERTHIAEMKAQAQLVRATEAERKLAPGLLAIPHALCETLIDRGSHCRVPPHQFVCRCPRAVQEGVWPRPSPRNLSEARIADHGPSAVGRAEPARRARSCGVEG